MLKNRGGRGKQGTPSNMQDLPQGPPNHLVAEMTREGPLPIETSHLRLASSRRPVDGDYRTEKKTTNGIGGGRGSKTKYQLRRKGQRNRTLRRA